MQLYGRHWTRRDLEAHVGRIEQLGGVQRVRQIEGRGRDVEQIQVRTGSGLAFDVLPDRGMDISLTSFGGAPLSWQAPNGDVHPGYYDDRDQHWLRSATGGLLMTCGMRQVGVPNVDEGEELGLHGRIHHTPAREVGVTTVWQGDEYMMAVRGVVEETIIYGEFLRLTRTITTRLGSSSLTIDDTVENLAFAPTPFMLMYHFNFGFPLLDAAAQISYPSRRFEPIDAVAAAAGNQGWDEPDPNYAARVYLHDDLVADDRGWAAAVIENQRFPLPDGPHPLRVTLAWDTSTLPKLTQWRMAGAGTHVLGIEPGNCHVRGRAAARADGSLRFLQPGESQTFHMSLTVELP
jgi:galactose mutarotase-like enzyme